MPVYVYSCHTCELELEETHPLGKAPSESIRCPLCGGMFTRDVALFYVNGRAIAPAGADPAEGASAERVRDPSIRHGVNCVCCTPRRAHR